MAEAHLLLAEVMHRGVQDQLVFFPLLLLKVVVLVLVAVRQIITADLVDLVAVQTMVALLELEIKTPQEIP